MTDFHQCDMSAQGMAPALCICVIGRDHDAYEMEEWEDNDWQDPRSSVGEEEG